MYFSPNIYMYLPKYLTFTSEAYLAYLKLLAIHSSILLILITLLYCFFQRQHHLLPDYVIYLLSCLLCLIVILSPLIRL